MSILNPLPAQLAVLSSEELMHLRETTPSSVYSYVGHVHTDLAGEFAAIDHVHDYSANFAPIVHDHSSLTTTHINNLTVENNEILNDTTTEGNLTFKNTDRSIRWPSTTPGIYDEILKYGVVNAAPSVVTYGGTNTNYHRFVAGGRETVITNDGKIKIGGAGGTVMGGELDIIDDKNGDEAGGIGIASYRDADMWGSFVYGVRYRGTVDTPSACQPGDSLMEFGCLGWDGANAVGGGELMWTVSGPVSAGVVPSKAEIFVTKSDGTMTQGLTINSDLSVVADTFVGNGSGLTNLPVSSGAIRPTGALVGFMFFDTTLVKPIWHSGAEVWVDATGVIV